MPTGLKVFLVCVAQVAIFMLCLLVISPILPLHLNIINAIAVYGVFAIIFAVTLFLSLLLFSKLWKAEESKKVIYWLTLVNFIFEFLTFLQSKSFDKLILTIIYTSLAFLVSKMYFAHKFVAPLSNNIIQ